MKQELETLTKERLLATLQQSTSVPGIRLVSFASIATVGFGLSLWGCARWAATESLGAYMVALGAWLLAIAVLQLGVDLYKSGRKVEKQMQALAEFLKAN